MTLSEVKIKLLAAQRVIHHVDGQLWRRQDRIGDLSNELLGLNQRLLGMRQQVFFDVMDRPCRVDESVFDPRRRFALLLDLLDQRALGCQRRMLVRERRRSDARHGRLLIAGQRPAIAARRIEAHARKAETADDLDLFVVLDAEVVEGKRMLEPLQIEVDVKPDPQLIDVDE